MPTTVPCLDARQLERLLAGAVPAQELDSATRHLEECPRCSEALDGLLKHDTLMELARSQTTVDEPDMVRGLIERIRGLRPLSTNPDAAQELFPFLAPPEQADEMGRLGGYRVLKVLGSGGMGVVFLAEDPRLRRPVALKVMRPEAANKPGARQRFLREAQLAAAVKHDHIVTIYQVSEDRGVPFLAMECLQGESMEEWLKRGRRPTTAQLLRIGREIARGLAAAHEEGLIHRDVKPGNLWLEAPTGRVKILDFGLARAAQDDVHLTQSGATVGTPSYMAPEQGQGLPVDHRCDLFSLGCVLYRLAAGRTPFRGDTTMAILTSLAVDRPQAVQELNPNLPGPLAELLMKLLARDPRERPSSAIEVVRQLQALERGLTPAVLRSIPAQPAAPTLAPTVELPPTPLPVAIPLEPPSRPLEPTVAMPVPVPSPRRRWRGAPLAAAVMLGLVGGGVWLFGPTVYRVATNQGELVVQVDDPNVEVAVKQNGAVVKDRTSKRDFVLTAVGGEVHVYEKDGVGPLTTRTFTLNRGGKTTVTVTLEELTAARNPKAPPPLDPAWLAKVRAMKPEARVRAVVEELKRRNPDFDGQVKPTIRGEEVVELKFKEGLFRDLEPLRALPKLEVLSAIHTKFERSRPTLDLDPLRGMPLRRLELHYNNLKDLAPLKGMPLEYLAISVASGVKDLSPLVGMKLKCAHFATCSIRDLSPLKGMPLERALLGGNPLEDLSPLTGLPLNSLYLASTNVSDLTPLKGMPLTALTINLTKVTDLTPLEGIALDTLNLDLKQYKGIEVVRGMKSLQTINGKPAAEFWKDYDARFGPTRFPPLNPAWLAAVRAMKPKEQVEAVGEELMKRNPGYDGKVVPVLTKEGAVAYLKFNGAAIRDLTPLQALPSLGGLSCYPVGAVEGPRPHLVLDPLKGLPLESLDITNCNCDDLTPLQGIKLQVLRFGDTSIKDLTPLKGMTSLKHLSCQTTPVTDLSPLKGLPLEWLDPRGIGVTDLTPLTGMPLKTLYLDLNKRYQGIEIVRGMKTLETINDKPAAEFWKVYDAKFGPPK